MDLSINLSIRMSTSKRVRRSLSLADKYAVIQSIEKGEKQNNIATKVLVSEGAISKIKKDAVSIREAVESGTQDVTIKRKRHFIFDDVENQLYNWFVRAQGTAGLSGSVLQEKARGIARASGAEDTEKIDLNWINRFKARRGIVSRKLHGEAAAVDLSDVNTWKSERLCLIRQQFEDKDVFNLDETGLFWKMLPNTTLQLKRCAGGKRIKDRITVLVRASACGEKLPLLVIRKYAKPRCFRNATLPIK